VSASRDPEPVGPALERLVIRPPKWEVGTLGVFLGIFGLGLAALGLFLLLHSGPDVAAPAVVAVPAFFLAALSFAMIPLSTGGTLWADAEWVGVNRPGLKVRCPRDELASVQLGPYVYRQGPSCSFVRKDGLVAFSTYLQPWTTSQIATLATFLGVPLTDAKDPVTYTCPVCGYPGLDEPADSGPVASHEICPSCGFEFSGPIDQRRYQDGRAEWVRGGMKWWAQGAGRPAPANWDPAKQLAALTGES
jgi:predicted RNA-binding Zn-ribbon protein involved in translation (DUF1610 family)